MTDSIEQLALSSTFAMVNGRLTSVADSGGRLSAAPDLRQDQVVDGKYRVIKLIGQGGMGAVYKVHHELLQKDMALKTVCTRSMSKGSWQRFQREAKAIAKLRHKNIVEVFDFGIEAGQLPYYTMELLNGESLADKLTASGPMKTAQALGIFMQVAEGMAHAHRLQIVHRDIKPANIFLADAGSSGGTPLVKVVDFGTAKLATEDDPGLQFDTGSGTIFGSPLYMSPEQSVGKVCDKRSDIYSFGCSLFQALTGKPPFVGDNAFLTMLSHQNDKAPTLQSANPDAQFSQRLEGLIAQLLAKSPDKRLQSFEIVLDELAYCLRSLKLNEKARHSASSGPSNDEPTAPAAVSPPRSKGRLALVLTAAGLLAAVIFVLAKNSLVPASHKKNTPTAIAVTAVAPVADATATGTDASSGSASAPALPAGSVQADLAPFPVKYTAVNGGQAKTFFFPKGDNCASIHLKGFLDMPCSGEVTILPNQEPILIGTQGLMPQFISRFRPNDLVSVRLQGTVDGEWSVEHMKAISHLTGLTELDISQSNLDKRSLPYIDKLVNLVRLKVAETNIHGDELAKLAILPHLKMLSLSKMERASDFIRNMPPSCRFVELIATSDSLTDEDMPYISRMPLLTLGLDGNHITAKGVKFLENAATVKDISMARCPIGPDCISTLRQLKHLRRLRMDTKGWSSMQVMQLKAALRQDCILTVPNAP